jgi:UDP-3-O-[3-hydroxymyristoyl] glucosamine N-acyltransferase
MKFKVSEIAALIGATVEGNPDAEVVSLGKIEEGKPGDLTFFANPKYEAYLYDTLATAVIVSTDYQLKSPVKATLLRSADPYSAFTAILKQAQSLLQDKKGIEQPSFIHPSAKVGEGVYIGAFAYVGAGATLENGVKLYPNTYVGDGAFIGEGSVLHPQVTVYHGCKVGKGCILHAGAVIGSDGFGFAPQADGSFDKIPQTGTVRLEDQVEIGANTTIDRATLGETVIKQGVKLDNLIQIAHNVEIGENTVIAAQTGISGSTKLGKNCMVGGQVGIVGHIKLADRTSIGAQSGISKNIEEVGKAFRGSPAQDYKKQLKSEAVFRNLDELAKKVAQLERQILNLQDR